MSMHDGTETTSGRYLKRKSEGRRLPRRCISLPEWCIVPRHRPLFACQNCGFANLFGELCLWCRGRCAVAHSGSTADRRRVSAPQLLNDIQKEQLCVTQRRVVILRVPCASVGACAAGTPTPPKPSCLAPSYKQNERPNERRRRHRDAALYTLDDMVAATQLTAQDDDYMASVFVRSLYAASSSTEPKLSSCVSEKAGPLEERQHEEKQQQQPTNSPHRTLRRRKRFSLTNKISSCSLRARITHATGGGQTELNVSKIDAGLCVTPDSTVVPTAAPSIILSVPLGPPGQPLYTSIRRNMFPASTSGLSASPSRFPPVRAMSIHEGALVRVPSSAPRSRAEDDWVYIPSFYPCTEGYGFSLSGETELRMALARQNPDGVHGTEEFRFQETKRIRPSTSSKVKSIGKNIKDFFSLRLRR